MRTAILFALLFLDPARDMLEDVTIRNDIEGGRLARERLLRVIAETDDANVQRDAHYAIALSAVFESFSGLHDLPSQTRVITSAIHHADRAVALDANFADAWMVAAMARGSAARLGVPVPKDGVNRFQKAAQLDAKAPAVAFFSAMLRSFNPSGAAPPEGVAMMDALAERLDKERAATGRRFGLLDAHAHAWTIMTRMASDEPRAEVLRPLAAKLMANRPDFDLGKQLAAAVAERRFVAAPAVTWQPFLTDAASDGKSPQHPDVVAVDRADDGERLWVRVRFREPLPRSFGVNLVVNRSGDPAAGMPWWGSGSTFRFDRLVTAWITRDGDRYFGRVGVTDDDGARGARLVKIPAEVALAMGDERTVIAGVPRAAIGWNDKSRMVVAGGSHLVWNDDAN